MTKIHQNNTNTNNSPRFRLGWNSWLVSGHTRFAIDDKFKVFCAGETVIEADSPQDAVSKWKVAFPQDYCWVMRLE